MVTESRFDQERRWHTEMAQLGLSAVRALHRQGKPVTSQPPHPDADFVESWLGRQDRRRVRRHLVVFLLIAAALLPLGLLMALIQALVFSLLTALYLLLDTETGEEEARHVA